MTHTVLKGFSTSLFAIESATTGMYNCLEASGEDVLAESDLGHLAGQPYDEHQTGQTLMTTIVGLG